MLHDDSCVCVWIDIISLYATWLLINEDSVSVSFVCILIFYFIAISGVYDATWWHTHTEPILSRESWAHTKPYKPLYIV